MDARGGHHRDEEEEAAAAPLLAGAAPLGYSGHRRSHAGDLHVLSAAFLFVFSAYCAAQNLESSVNTEGDLGTVSMGILYTSFTLFSVAASPVVTWLGSKRALVVGTSGYVIFILANLVPTWYTMVPASLYLGFTASIIWVGQGTYLTSAALSHARDNNLPEGQTLGNFNGEFWGMFASTQVIGNLISLALLRDGKDGGSVTGKSLLFVVFLGCMIVGIILMCLLSKRDEKGNNAPTHSSFGAMMKYIVAPLKDRRMILIIPLIAYSGLQQAFVWAVFTKNIVTPVLGISGVGGAMAIYGAADVVCSLVAGRLTSGLHSATSIVSVGAILQAVVLFWLLLFYSPMGGLLGAAVPLFIGALWGVGDGVLNTQLSALLGLLFEDVKEAAFAQLKVWQSGAIAVIFFLSPNITLQAMLILMATALIISFGAFLLLTLVVEKPSTVRSNQFQSGANFTTYLDQCYQQPKQHILYARAIRNQKEMRYLSVDVQHNTTLTPFVSAIFAELKMSVISTWFDEKKKKVTPSKKLPASTLKPRGSIASRSFRLRRRGPWTREEATTATTKAMRRRPAGAGADGGATAPLLAGVAPLGYSGHRWSHAGDLHVLSAAFLFIFSAYCAAQNLQSSVNTEGDLGTVSMGILYTSFTLFAVTASPVVTWLGSKRALVVGTSGYVIFILANLVPTWYLLASELVKSSVASSNPAHIIYLTLQGTYLTSAALSHARDNNLPEGQTLGNFNGEFWGMFASTQVIGNLISLALLRDGKDYKRHLAVFTKNIVTPVLGVSGVGGAMAIYGAADAVCALVAGRLTSGLHSATSIVSVGAILHAVVLFWLLLFYSPMGGLLGAAVPLFIGALWGVGDGVLHTQLSALLGLLFEDVKEAAFAQWRVWQSGAIAVIFFLSPNITLQAMLILMAIALIISFGSFLLLTLVVEKPSTTRS
uniref:UNC93-like protein 3 n=1 Tax=Oryza rufipogon TaxID=4529 RepID=A0A0E0RIV8_ORYRU